MTHILPSPNPKNPSSDNMLATQEIKLEKKLPKGWEWKTIKEITSVLGDGLHGTPIYSDHGEYFFINGNNLTDGKIEIKENTKRVALKEFEKYKKPLNDQTIFVSINGTLGNTAFYNNEKVILGKSACYFNVLSTINKRYVRYCLTTHRFTKYAINEATGSTIKNVGLKAMRDFEIPIPPLPEQHRLVQKIEELFSELDYAITTLKTTQQQLQTYRQSVLKHAFEGKLTEAWRKNIVKPTNKFEKKVNKIEPLRHDELIELPELQDSWQWIKIGQILDVFVGSTPSRKVSEYWEGNISWVSSGEVRNNFIIATKEKITESGLENSATKVHPPGTVLIAMIGEGKTRGQAAILKIPAAHNQNTAAIRLEKEKYLSKLLYYYFIYTYEKNRNVGSGNNQKALNKSIIENIPIPYCRIDEQEQIITEIETRLSESDYLLQTINQQLTHAESLRQSILQRAFSGEL